jgi:5-methylcytosine-specific restriction protein A
MTFEELYGDVGHGFIEVHHVRPVHELQPGDKTKLGDLVLVCANCHRMIHRRRPWLSMSELGAIMRC